MRCCPRCHPWKDGTLLPLVDIKELETHAADLVVAELSTVRCAFSRVRHSVSIGGRVA
jgi:hypothetical protein